MLSTTKASFALPVRVIEVDDDSNPYALERAFEQAVRDAKAAEQRELVQYFNPDAQQTKQSKKAKHKRKQEEYLETLRAEMAAEVAQESESPESFSLNSLNSLNTYAD